MNLKFSILDGIDIIIVIAFPLFTLNVDLRERSDDSSLPHDLRRRNQRRLQSGNGFGLLVGRIHALETHCVHLSCVSGFGIHLRLVHSRVAILVCHKR